jgi:Tetratricopeptide repeat/Protein of unknown function (DUF1570)
MRLIAAVLLLFCASAVQAKWLEVTSPNFIVYSDGKEPDLRKFAERLERFNSVMRLMTGIDAEPIGLKLKVFLLSSERAVRDMYPGDAKRVAGFYTTSLHGPVTYVPRLKNDGIFSLDGEQILFHEYAHHFMRQYTRSPYPTWYVEGFAEYFSSVEFKEREQEIHVGKAVNYRLPSLYLESWVPLEKLMTLTYQRKEKITDQEMSQLYAQGWLLTHYLFNAKDRKGQIGQYVKNLNKGMPEKEAFQTAFNADHATLHKELRSYFKGGKIPYQKLTIKNAQPIALTVRALTPAEDATLLPVQKLRLFVPKAERDAFNLAFTKTVTPHLQTDAGRLAQAEWEIRFGEASKVATLLAPVLAQNPNEPTALLLQAIQATRAAKKAPHPERTAAMIAARKLAAKANRAATETPFPLLLYFQSYALAGEEIPEQAINGLTKAWELLPQDTALTFTLASALASRKRFDEAKFLLAPILNSPHGGRAAQEARRMMDKIEARNSGGGIMLAEGEEEGEPE